MQLRNMQQNTVVENDHVVAEEKAGFGDQIVPGHQTTLPNDTAEQIQGWSVVGTIS